MSARPPGVGVGVRPPAEPGRLSPATAAVGAPAGPPTLSPLSRRRFCFLTTSLPFGRTLLRLRIPLCRRRTPSSPSATNLRACSFLPLPVFPKHAAHPSIAFYVLISTVGTESCPPCWLMLGRLQLPGPAVSAATYLPQLLIFTRTGQACPLIQSLILEYRNFVPPFIFSCFLSLIFSKYVYLCADSRERGDRFSPSKKLKNPVEIKTTPSVSETEYYG